MMYGIVFSGLGIPNASHARDRHALKHKTKTCPGMRCRRLLSPPQVPRDSELVRTASRLRGRRRQTRRRRRGPLDDVPEALDGQRALGAACVPPLGTGGRIAGGERGEFTRLGACMLTCVQCPAQKQNFDTFQSLFGCSPVLACSRKMCNLTVHLSTFPRCFCLFLLSWSACLVLVLLVLLVWLGSFALSVAVARWWLRARR